MGIRSFLAFELPSEIKKQIIAVSKELKKTALPVRWVKTENIHLTILFLGSVDEDAISDIEEKVNVVVRGFSAFKIKLNAVGTFPHWKRPRVIWIGLDGDIGKLSNFRNDLQEKLKILGFIPEKRPFQPHLTLGRFKRSLDRDADIQRILDSRYHTLNSELYYLDELVLYKSDLKPEGPVYTKMATWPLKVENSEASS